MSFSLKKIKFNMWQHFTVKKSQTYIYIPIYLLLLTFVLPIEYYYFYNDTNITNNINTFC